MNARQRSIAWTWSLWLAYVAVYSFIHPEATSELPSSIRLAVLAFFLGLWALGVRHIRRLQTSPAHRARVVWWWHVTSAASVLNLLIALLLGEARELSWLGFLALASFGCFTYVMAEEESPTAAADREREWRRAGLVVLGIAMAFLLFQAALGIWAVAHPRR